MAPYWKAPASGTRRSRCCELLALSSRTQELGDLAHTAALVSIRLQPGLGLLICGMGVLAGECQVWSPAQGSLEFRLAMGLSSEDVRREKDLLRHHCPAVHSDGGPGTGGSQRPYNSGLLPFALIPSFWNVPLSLWPGAFLPSIWRLRGGWGDWGQAGAQGLPGAWR